MRGSIYYQTSVLTKLVFRSGAKKENRKDENSDEFNLVASFNSMDSYRKIWNDLGFYIYEIYGIKDLEKLEFKYIEKFMYEKIFQNISHKYLQKISSSIGKLEFALNRFAQENNRGKTYDFSNRLKVVKEAKEMKLTTDNYRDRAYKNPEQIILLLNDEKFKIAAEIQLSGGARAEGVCLIKKEQIQGLDVDTLSNSLFGSVQTKEKGGKTGIVKVSLHTYKRLNTIIKEAGVFKIDYKRYVNSIQNACRVLGIKSEGTHGFRWNFAQNRVLEYQDNGYSHQDSLQMVSYEMKHMRPDITTHYTG